MGLGLGGMVHLLAREDGGGGAVARRIGNDVVVAGRHVKQGEAAVERGLDNLIDLVRFGRARPGRGVWLASA